MTFIREVVLIKGGLIGHTCTYNDVHVYIQVKHDQRTDEEGLEQIKMKKNELTNRQEQLEEQRTQQEQRIDTLEQDIRYLKEWRQYTCT